MARSLNLSLTDELRAFVEENSGLIRERKERTEAAELRKAVLEGYDDVLHGRTHEYTGDLRSMLDTFRAKRRCS